MKRHTRFGIVAFTLGTCLLAGYAQFREAEQMRSPVPSELFDTVQTQISAIRLQHFQQAYLQVSSNYQDSHDLDRFIEVVRGDCGAMRQASRWEFGIPSIQQESAEVPVKFFLPNGEVHATVFTIVRENRAWKIDFVRVFPLAVPPREIGGLRM